MNNRYKYIGITIYSHNDIQYNGAMMETKNVDKKTQVKLREFPCDILKYCPYGCLVEYFPLRGKIVSWNGLQIEWIKPIKESKPCPTFGHDCPVFYVAEDIK